MIIENKTSCK